MGQGNSALPCPLVAQSLGCQLRSEHRWTCSFGLLLESFRTWWWSWPNICYFSQSEIFKICKYKHFTEESHTNLLWIEAAPGLTGLWPSCVKQLFVPPSTSLIKRRCGHAGVGALGTSFKTERRCQTAAFPSALLSVSSVQCYLVHTFMCRQLHVQGCVPQPSQGNTSRGSITASL